MDMCSGFGLGVDKRNGLQYLNLTSAKGSKV